MGISVKAADRRYEELCLKLRVFSRDELRRELERRS